MKILLISNQKFSENKPGNPVVNNLYLDLKSLDFAEEVKLLIFDFSFKTVINFFRFRKKFDIIHVNFGGLYAFILGIIFLFDHSKKIITFHGTDIHGKCGARFFSPLFIKVKLNSYFSFFSVLFFDKIGFVSANLMNELKIFKSKHFLHKLSVNYDDFPLIDKTEAKKKLNLLNNVKYILFSSISSNPVKRFDLAKEIVGLLPVNYQLLTMTNIPSNEVYYYLNASECILITSISEGSPNIVREALVVNKPIFSFDVGDVKDYISLSVNSKIIGGNVKESSEFILKSLKSLKPENTRNKYERILSSRYVTLELIDNYKKLLK